MTRKRPFVKALVLLTALSLVPACSGGKSSRPDILFITIDTQRVDRLGCYGYEKNISPNIDAFSGEAVCFESHYSQAPLTLPSHTSIFTGLYPFHHGARANGIFRVTESAISLAELLKGQGYDTAAVVSAGVLHSAFGLNQGFDQYSWEEDEVTSEGQTDAEHATNRAVQWLEKRKGTNPFFLWVHYYDPHGPFNPPIHPPPRFTFPSHYDCAVAYTDEQIGVLFQALRKKGLFEDALIVLTSDHGQSFGEHGYEGHIQCLYDQTLHIPLLIRFPFRQYAGKRIKSLTRNVDLMPTLLSFLRLPFQGRIDGADLMAGIRGKGPFPEEDAYGETQFVDGRGALRKSLVSGKWKLIERFRLPGGDDFSDLVTPPLANRPRLSDEDPGEAALKKGFKLRELYNLEVDKGENRNQYYVRPDVAKELVKKLKKHIPRPGYEPPANLYAPQGELKEKLRALGYLR